MTTPPTTERRWRSMVTIYRATGRTAVLQATQYRVPMFLMMVALLTEPVCRIGGQPARVVARAQPVLGRQRLDGRAGDGPCRRTTTVDVMAKNRERRRGFVARWLRRIWWLRRVLVLGAIVGGAVKTLKSRGGGGGAAIGSGGSGGGPGGSGRPAPIGGPFSPTRSAAATPPPSEPDAAEAPVGGVRTLVSVPPLPDSGGAEDPDGNDDAPDTAVTGASLAAVADTADDATTTDSDRAWAEPLDDGGCPPSHPIKANDNSGIYHVPGGRFYERTVAERCYSTAEAAEADGYRPAKA